MVEFSLLIGLGVTIGLGWAVARSSEHQNDRIFNLGVAVLLCALAGSRVYYVIANWGYYRLHLLDFLWVWEGGFSGAGALVGGCLGLLIAGWSARQPATRIADQLLPLLASVSVAGWLACWLANCAYGAISRAWWALPVLDGWDISDRRVPVQLIGVLLSASLFAWLEFRRRSFRIPGLAASIGLFGASLIMFGISFLRTDPMPFWSGLRADTWGTMSGMAVSVLFGLYTFLSYHREGP